MATISSLDGQFSPADTVLASTEAVCIFLSVRGDNGENNWTDYVIKLCSFDNKECD